MSSETTSMSLSWVPPVVTILWALICLRLYSMISTENRGQRRLIAVCGAFGAAMIWLLSSNITSLLRLESKPAERAEPSALPRVELRRKN
jgi:hypothetical protein